MPFFYYLKHEVLRHLPVLFRFLPGGVPGTARGRTRLGLLALQLVLVRSAAGAPLCGRGKGKFVAVFESLKGGKLMEII